MSKLNKFEDVDVFASLDAKMCIRDRQYRKWSYDSLPILPQEWQYSVAADKGKQFKILKDLMPVSYTHL